MSPATDDEKEKWDNYYVQQTVVPDDPDTERFYRELAEAMLAFLPQGSKVLEAGCGSGMHSLALARLGGCEVRLLDISPQAIAFARKVFAAANVQAAYEIGDVFAAAGEADHDMVFNSGVLEHYEFDRQVAFLKGMARRSRRYVFVLVPNRECYWYWIWRIRDAAAGRWSFGYEKPAADYRAAMEAAALHYLGKAYFGAGALNRFLASLEGLSPELRALIEQVHDQEVVSSAQRSYLVGFLAAVTPGEATPPGFVPGGDDLGYLDSDRVDRYVALLGDSLAGQLAAEHRLAACEARLAAALRRQQELEAQNGVLADSLERCCRAADAARCDLQRVLNSTSWKVSAPVRAVGRLLRRYGPPPSA